MNTKQRIILWITVTVIVILLGLHAEEKRVPGRIIEASFELYGIRIGYYRLLTSTFNSDGTLLDKGGDN